ncbi:BREX system Lon protease-like protein BrxL [Arthrobacter bambusae]|uniref:BREX system Lon protease-like protein BrxL n=1 Tax=Arthrobacter bambusae TaxID=1338426 RepID=UPI002785B9A9|nr:BREX system Lon protease-like protein BrxL [Arthrobacter bambusae]MDQ0030893.1 ATP-dependent Lon protease [Arthrobacter bambusae]MDQ0099258.1 ATP-dependent Lon protease [Arthrobacter bambusae]
MTEDTDLPLIDRTPQQTALDKKINQHFAGLVVRKDLVKAVKGNAIVPSYVLEYLLGQYAASDDEATIQAGIGSVRQILADHYVHRNQSELVKSTIRERGRYKIIDKVTVSLNDKEDRYEAEFSNLGIKGVIAEPATVNAHPKLLVGGVWCICDIDYFHFDDTRVTPWQLGSLKPIQLSNFDFDGYATSRLDFTTDEWIDLLIQSIGFNPELFGRRAKLLQLVRLIPFVERNYNLVELGPKGTGKSHIFSEFSPHGMLISGGEVTVPKLFVNNSNGRIGLVGYWDVVAFDEFAGKKKRTDKALVDIMKNYMANKSFSRGVEPLGAEASMVFVGNTSHTVPYMLKHSDLFDELPESYHDSAYLDRLHFYIPGWEVDTIRGEMFSEGYGFVVDYIAEVLKSMRNADYSDRFQRHFTLSSDISTRDRDGIHKTFSGLMKILFPHGDATKEEIEEILRFAIEGRKRVKDQILRIDSTMAAVKFGYLDKDGAWHAVTTLEEDEYPGYYRNGESEPKTVNATSPDAGAPSPLTGVAQAPAPQLFEGHREFQENQRGVSYKTLLLPYLSGATNISIIDPYIRLPHQGRNLVDLLALLATEKDSADEISVTLVTKEDKIDVERRQLFMLNDIQESAAAAGIHFTVAWDDSIHDRSIRADNGWKILLGRGLDIFQKGSGSQYELGTRSQQFRQVAAFGITYIRGIERSDGDVARTPKRS